MEEGVDPAISDVELKDLLLTFSSGCGDTAKVWARLESERGKGELQGQANEAYSFYLPLRLPLQINNIQKKCELLFRLDYELSVFIYMKDWSDNIQKNNRVKMKGQR